MSQPDAPQLHASDQGPLHLVRVPGHDQIRHECECPRLGAQFLGSPGTPGPTIGTPDLPLQHVGPLVVV